MISQLFYTSLPVLYGGAGVDRDILSVARRMNAEHGITGFLLRSDSLFLQYIEGPEPALRQLMVNIRADKRHREIVACPVIQAETRRFPHWSMGYSYTMGEEQFADTVRRFGRHIPPARVAARLASIARLTA